MPLKKASGTCAARQHNTRYRTPPVDGCIFTLSFALFVGLSPRPTLRQTAGSRGVLSRYPARPSPPSCFRDDRLSNSSCRLRLLPEAPGHCDSSEMGSGVQNAIHNSQTSISFICFPPPPRVIASLVASHLVTQSSLSFPTHTAGSPPMHPVPAALLTPHCSPQTPAPLLSSLL